MRFDPRPEIRRGRPGQCEACGAFRTDGRPVTAHFTGCEEGPDASQAGILGHGVAYLHADHITPVPQARMGARKGKRVVTGPSIPENVSVQRGTWRRR